LDFISRSLLAITFDLNSTVTNRRHAKLIVPLLRLFARACSA